jgi:hypothetical protein
MRSLGLLEVKKSTRSTLQTAQQPQRSVKRPRTGLDSTLARAGSSNGEVKSAGCNHPMGVTKTHHEAAGYVEGVKTYELQYRGFGECVLMA